MSAKLYTADFETTTDPNDCRVWAAGICSIDDNYNFQCGNNIDYFLNFAQHSDNSSFYFHNVKFDGEFIIYYLFKHGYKHITERKKLRAKTFTTLISDKGQFYSMEICFENNNKVKIYDSLKILPFKVEEVAEAFNLPIAKQEIDYNEKREIGHELTQKETYYLRCDCEVIARALKILFDQGLTKMTQGSNALADYTKIIGQKNFKKWFPIPLYDADIRQSYKGGFTYLNPKYKNVDLGEGIVLDVNSLYPSVMYYSELPYGEGIFFKGKYKDDSVYKLYIQMFKCSFEIKKDYLPTIQLKNNLAFNPIQYLDSSEGDEVTLCLTSVDLKLFLEHYNVYNIEYLSGWKFKATRGLFKDYIDKWMSIKIEATKNGNHAMRTLAKLMLNALYGKFGLNPHVCSKIPVLDEDIIKYKLGKDEMRDPIYIPLASFITAWARYKTISSAQSVYERFVYADTDSLHLIGTDIPDNLDISDTELGKWKIESKFKRARFIRQKCYVEDEVVKIKEFKDIHDPANIINTNFTNGDVSSLKITCAGMPKSCYTTVCWENFHELASFRGKLTPKHVPGGIILESVDYTIKI